MDEDSASSKVVLCLLGVFVSWCEEPSPIVYGALFVPLREVARPCVSISRTPKHERVGGLACRATAGSETSSEP